MVIFHSYVSLPEGTFQKLMSEAKSKPFWGLICSSEINDGCHVFELGTCCRHRWVWRRHFTGRAQRMKVQEWASWRFFSEGAGLGLLLHISIPTLTTTTFYFRCGKICNGCIFCWPAIQLALAILIVKLFLVSTVSVRTWPTLAAISQAESKGSHLVQSVFTPFVLTGATAIRKNSWTKHSKTIQNHRTIGR